MKSIKINTIYPTFDGEQNPHGIGYPTLFVRFQGCHIRCYKSTLLTMCDTPEALELNSDQAIDYTPEKLALRIAVFLSEYGMDKVTITGGDPLFRHKEETLHELFEGIRSIDSFVPKVTVETSGTISPLPYLRYDNVSFILDYKLKSTGIPKKMNKLRDFALTRELRSHDYVKYVVYDDKDYEEMVDSLAYFENSKAVLTAGVYFQGPLSTFDLFNRLKQDRLLSRIRINAQVHQLEKYMDKTLRDKDLGVDI